ncbi:MAG: hypothetical protein ABIR38_09390 [Chthoniobacterales bacterium]
MLKLTLSSIRAIALPRGRRGWHHEGHEEHEVPGVGPESFAPFVILVVVPSLGQRIRFALRANLFVAPRVTRPLLFPRMFRFRFSPLAALAGLIIVFSSCERHYVGELPELQKEHLHPLEASAEEPIRAIPTSPLPSSTPANFFPKQQP